jgi:glycerate kinase
LQNIKFTVICDVKNKLCGLKSAVFTYGKQKGAQDDDLKVLESGLINLIKKTNGEHLGNIEGAGAAGGLGFGMMAFLHASIFHGIDWVIDFTDFEKEVQEADIVITGEGKIDNQTFAEKLLQGKTKYASKYDKPVIGICSSLQVTNEEILQLGLKAAFSITPYPSSIVEALEETEANLTNTSFNIGKLLL